MDILIGVALSLHIGFQDQYNNLHPQIRLQSEEFISGIYYNSEDKLSAYAGMEFNKGLWSHEIGIVSGYENSAVQPFVRSTYAFSNTVKGFVSPAIEKVNGKESVGIVLGIEFWK